jgi:guanylate kinase
MSSTPFIVTLTGPSCAGKSTLEARLKEVGFEAVISTTTRPPRAGEINGKSYHFIDKSEFKRLEATGFFVETVKFNGNYYGVSAQEIQRVADQGKPIVVIVEPEGWKQVRAYCRAHSWEIFSVFIDNPGEVIAKRFIERMHADLKLADLGTANGVIDTYSKRLGVMLKDECWWGEDMGTACELWLHNFDESNIEDVVTDIGRRAVDALAVA